MLVASEVRPLTKRPLHAWSVPNLLTYARVVAVPALIGCFYLEAPLNHWLGFIVFTVASITDFFDGYLARAWHQQSAIGQMLDPIADKLLVGVALLMLAWSGAIGSWSVLAAAVILMREISVSGLREFLAGLRVKMPVTSLAKYKTTAQMTAIGCLLLAPIADEWLGWVCAGMGAVAFGGLFLLWLSALLTVFTGYSYFREGIRCIKEDMVTEA